MVSISKLALGFVGSATGLLVIMAIAANYYPELLTQGNALNTSGIPLGDFFATGGIMWVLFAVGIFITGLGLVMAYKGS